MLPPSSCLRGLFSDHLPLEGIASLLPVEKAASIAAHMRVAVMHQVLVGDDAGTTRRVGTVDDNLIVLGERGQRFLWREEVKRARDMFRTVLPGPQSHHQFKLILALQFPLQLITVDQLHGIFHRSISSSFGFEHEYVADGGVWYSYEVTNQWTILVRRLVLATSTAYGSNSPRWT